MISPLMSGRTWLLVSPCTCLGLNSQEEKPLIRLHLQIHPWILLHLIPFAKAMYQGIFSEDSAQQSGTLRFIATFLCANQSNCSSEPKCSMYSIIPTLGSPAAPLALRVLDYQPRHSIRASLDLEPQAQEASILCIRLEGLAQFRSR